MTTKPLGLKESQAEGNKFKLRLRWISHLGEQYTVPEHVSCEQVNINRTLITSGSSLAVTPESEAELAMLDIYCRSSASFDH